MKLYVRHGGNESYHEIDGIFSSLDAAAAVGSGDSWYAIEIRTLDVEGGEPDAEWVRDY